MEELLQPRFKVIAPYPCSIHKLEDIILTYESAMSYAVQIDDVSEKICLKDYPHIFKKLEWFEDRKIEDLPKYLKDEFETYNDYYEVLQYSLNLGTVDVINNKYGLLDDQFIETFKPATKEEYETNKTI